jgi:hypothetical protein
MVVPTSSPSPPFTSPTCLCPFQGEPAHDEDPLRFHLQTGTDGERDRNFEVGGWGGRDLEGCLGGGGFGGRGYGSVFGSAYRSGVGGRHRYANGFGGMAARGEFVRHHRTGGCHRSRRFERGRWGDDQSEEERQSSEQSIADREDEDDDDDDDKHDQETASAEIVRRRQRSASPSPESIRGRRASKPSEKEAQDSAARNSSSSSRSHGLEGVGNEQEIANATSSVPPESAPTEQRQRTPSAPEPHPSWLLRTCHRPTLTESPEEGSLRDSPSSETDVRRCPYCNGSGMVSARPESLHDTRLSGMHTLRENGIANPHTDVQRPGRGHVRAQRAERFMETNSRTSP